MAAWAGWDGRSVHLFSRYDDRLGLFGLVGVSLSCFIVNKLLRLIGQLISIDS